MKKQKAEILDLYDLMLEQLRDLYDGEKQQLEVFPKLDQMANSLELSEIIERHELETKRQVVRLENAFYNLEENPRGELCEGIRGLIKEALNLAERCKNPEVLDAGLITSIQHINHYEMAGYGTAISYAKALERHNEAELLLETLREEKSADWGLSDLAEGQVNPDAKWSSLVKKLEAGGKKLSKF